MKVLVARAAAVHVKLGAAKPSKKIEIFGIAAATKSPIREQTNEVSFLSDG